jgi:caspase domain-containing protein
MAWLLFSPSHTFGLLSDHLIAIAAAEVPRILLVDIDKMGLPATIEGATETSGIEKFRLSEDGRFLLQSNKDGKFFLYSIKQGKRVLSGVVVDDEVVVYTDEGYYEATPEGAHYVYWLFPGLREHFSFSQFQQRLHRPDLIRALLHGEDPPRPAVDLVAPPSVEFDVLPPQQADRERITIRATAKSADALKVLRLFVDGVPVEEVTLVGREATIERTVIVSQGTHWVTAVAYDTSGYSSVPKSARVDGSASLRPKGRLMYVGVAVDDYPAIPNANLSFAKRDMALLADTVKARAAQQYRDVQTVLLPDEKAHSAAILSTLREVVANAERDDTVLVSFAGHGVSGPNGSFFFVTSGATATDPTANSLNWDKVAEVLAGSQAKVIVLLDACHAGFASQETVIPNDAYASALMRSGKAGIAVLAASKGRQFSLENSNLAGGHGLFSYAVARALDEDRGTADWRRDGVIDLDSLYRYVKRSVSDMAATAGYEQTPWLSRDELIGRVPIL